MATGWALTVAPAYGRNYQTAKEAFADFLANKDFYIKTPGYPSYCSRSDLENYGIPSGNKITIRYRKMTLLLIATYNAADKSWTMTCDEDLEE